MFRSSVHSLSAGLYTLVEKTRCCGTLKCTRGPIHSENTKSYRVSLLQKPTLLQQKTASLKENVTEERSSRVKVLQGVSG